MNIALFDFDGTITFGDTFTPFVKMAVPKYRLIPGMVLLFPAIALYKLGIIKSPLMRKLIVAVAFTGIDKAHIAPLGERYANETLVNQIRPEAAKQLAWHKKNGDKVVIVSASLDFYLQPWVASQGYELICSSLVAHSDRLTGRYYRGDCTGHEKSVRVTEQFDLSQYDKVYAYGDTEEDQALLALADIKYFDWKLVEPKST